MTCRDKAHLVEPVAGRINLSKMRSGRNRPRERRGARSRFAQRHIPPVARGYTQAYLPFFLALRRPFSSPYICHARPPPAPPASLCSPPVLSRTIIPLRADARTHKQRVNARGETTQKKRGGQKGGGGQSRAQTQGVKGEDSYVSRMHARARARMTHAFMNGRFSSGLLARSRARGSERAGARSGSMVHRKRLVTPCFRFNRTCRVTEQTGRPEGEAEEERAGNLSPTARAIAEIAAG